MIPSVSEPNRFGLRLDDDDDRCAGFAPRCPACGTSMQPHGSRERAWWQCGGCAFPLIG